MKKLLIISMILIAALNVEGQTFAKVDKSVLDIAYLPHNFAHDREEGDKAVIKVVYSRPLKNDRMVFGGLIAFDKVWRTGANEATEIKFYRDVKMGGETVKAGTYSLFTVPGKERWTIILNGDLDYWGHYSYDDSADQYRFQVMPKIVEKPVEAFTIQFSKKGESPAKMMMAWDTVLVEVPIEY